MLARDGRSGPPAELRQSIRQQLEILKYAVNAATVLILCPGPDSGQLLTYVSVSSGNDVLPGPFHPGAGIIGALKEQVELALAPLSAGSPRIPYYRRSLGEGGFFARKLIQVTDQQQRLIGLLCLDRTTPDSWTAPERNLIALTAERICSSFSCVQNFLYADFERHSLQQAFNGLQRLNKTLTLESVYVAVVEALHCIVETDLAVIGSVHRDIMRIRYVAGDKGGQDLLGREFELTDSIAGQAVKYRRILPDATTPPQSIQIIKGSSLFAAYGSVLVVPLALEDGTVTALMMLAARDKQRFPRSCREMMTLIAAQGAIRLDLADAHEQINAMSLNDPLTGIPNRRAFDRALISMEDRAQRRLSSFSLVICDIDHFKRINDTYGHPFGDQVIQEVSRQLAEIVRSGDLAARIGGEEFALLLEDTGEKGAFKVAERLRKKISRLDLFHQETAVSVTISIGIAAFPADATGRDQLFNCADQALYRAKGGGRNQTQCWRVLRK